MREGTVKKGSPQNSRQAGNVTRNDAILQEPPTQNDIVDKENHPADRCQRDDRHEPFHLLPKLLESFLKASFMHREIGIDVPLPKN